MMQFSIILTALVAFVATVRAGTHKPVIEIETVHIIEYTEVCECPTATVLPVPAITTLTCCDVCAPITITAIGQPVTSCTTTFTPTTTICEETGVYYLGENWYPCNNAPCLIEYSAPCPTCYVCVYSDCWAAGAILDSKPKHVKVYEYYGDNHNQVGYWEESWAVKTWEQYYTKTREFLYPTIFIENNITIDITVAPTVITYTQTSTTTTTETKTVTASNIPTSHPRPVSSANPTASPRSSVSPSSTPSSTPAVDLKFVLMSGEHAGYPVIIRDGRLAYGDTKDEATVILRLNQEELFDLDGRITYLSLDDLTSNDKSFLYFVSTSSVPSDGLVKVFSVDGQGSLVVTVDGVELVAIICDNDGYIQFGHSAGSCEAVVLVPESKAVTSTPQSAPSSTPYSTPISIPSSEPVSSALPSLSPSASYPVSIPESYTPSEVPSSQPTSEPPSTIPSEAPSSAPSSEPPLPSATYNYAIASTSPIPRNIQQGGGQVNEQVEWITLRAFDQYDQPFPNKTFKFSCDDPSEQCVFRMTFTGDTIDQATTDETGTVTFLYSDIKAGDHWITISTDDDNFVAQCIVTVLPEINCPLCAPYFTSTIAEDYRLVIGRDTPTLEVTTYDMAGDRMGSVDVTFKAQAAITRKRSPDNVITSDPWTGAASYNISNNNGPSGAQTWEVQPAGCSSAISAETVFWAWGIDCSSSTVTLDKTSAYKDEVVTLSGQYSTIRGATVGNGANVVIRGTPAGDTIVSLSPDGSFTWSTGYTGLENGWNISVSFIQSYDPCYKDGPDLGIIWMDRLPICGVGASTMVLSASNPYVTDTVAITITALDAGSNPIPNLPYSFYSTTRESLPSEYQTSGLLDENGQVVIYYPNGGFGGGMDSVRAHLGASGGNGCDLVKLIMWDSNV